MKLFRRTRGIPARRLLALTAVLISALTFASTASATLPGTINMDPTSPVVGESVTFTDATSTDCGKSYTFTVDGQALPPQASPTITRSFSTAGSHTVSDTAVHTSGGCQDYASSVKFTVYTTLQGTIAVSPDPPVVNKPARLSATQTGGTGNYTYAWDTNNDGNFDNGTTRTVTPTFTTTGPHVVRVKIDDDATPAHETIVTRTLIVQKGSTGPPPPPCVNKLDFQLSEFTTDGCFTKIATSPSERWTTTSAVKLNGIPFPDFGQTFTITFPTPSEPGGHFSATGAVIRLGSLTAFKGNINWKLPAGKKGEEKDLTTFTVTAGAQLFGLGVRGSIALRLGWAANGTHYATFPLSIQLPGGFRAGPDPSFGSVTGTASLRVDEGRIHFDGLKLEAANVWIGNLKVDQACFSFVPAGGQSVAPCAAPTLDGTPYITCASNVNTNRWNGNAVIELPKLGAQDAVKLAAFGGLADGQVSELGGYVDGLGRRAPIAPNVFLDRIGVGLCLTPPPLTVRGDVGVAIFPTSGGEALAKIDGHVIYTDSYPWKLEIGGTVTAVGTQIGTGSVTLDGWGDVTFDLAAGVDLFGVASINGHIDGWVDPPSKQYAVSGGVNACITGVGCADGSGVISSTGVAGCITITSSYQSPDLVITLGDPPTIGFARSYLYINAGVGYRWGASSPDIFGNSCDLSSYQPTRPFARDARAGQISERVAAGTTVLSWRIHGTHGPPKVVIRGPGGRTITSPAQRRGAQRKGHWMLVENPANGTTNVLLIHPAAGTWTVRAAPGSTSSPTTIDQAKLQVPPTLAAGVRGTGAVRTLQMAYAVPRGASVRLVERGKGVERTIVRSVRGHRCDDAPARRPGSDEAILCLNLRFRPARGPGGVRKIQALVTRGSIPLFQKDIASFRAPRLTLPSRPRFLLARRGKGNLRVAFTRSRGASRYLVSVSLSDGRELAYDLGAQCQAVLIKGVSARIAARVRVAGMRYDLAVGAKRSLSIRARAKSAGPKGTLPRTLRRPRKICS